MSAEPRAAAAAGPILVIAEHLPAARALAAELVAEHGLDPADVYPLAVGAAPRSRAYTAAIIALPPRGLTAADVAWVEDAVLVRLKRGAELVVRFNPREDAPAPHPPAVVERVAAAIEALCPDPDDEHAGGHCPYQEAAAAARKVGRTPPITLVRVVQTCPSLPSQWDAWDTGGRYYYLRYRSGRGTVDTYENPDRETWTTPPDGGVAHFERGDAYDGEIALTDFLNAAGLELAADAEVVPTSEPTATKET